MPSPTAIPPGIPFAERVHRTPICELQLRIDGTPLEPVIEEFRQEVRAKGIRIQPHCYLADQWGVPFGSISIGIPFYLASDELTAYHGEQAGLIEGAGRADLLRYLRHEMGHVVNYAYRLYETEEWVALFGSMTQPYVEEYRPIPFSRRFVRHLPGWYAQKHPDEDWAESFAVWMAPGDAWREDYKDWPTARAKLEYCERRMRELSEQEPPAVVQDADESVESIRLTAEQFYEQNNPLGGEFPEGLDGALRSIFEDVDRPEYTTTAVRRPAAELVRRLKNPITSDVFRWTGHFPEHTHRLLRHLSARLESLSQVYPEDREAQVIVALTALVTSLAMNHVFHGSYLPEVDRGTGSGP